MNNININITIMNMIILYWLCSLLKWYEYKESPDDQNYEESYQDSYHDYPYRYSESGYFFFDEETGMIQNI